MRLTVNDPGYSPESQQDEETHSIKDVFEEDDDDVQDKGHQHHQSVKHLKLVLEELQAKREQLRNQLHHEEGEQGQAQVVKHLSNTKMKTSTPSVPQENT